MSCYLSIIGEDLDADQFVVKLGLTYLKITKKGEPRFKTQPERGPIPYTVVNYQVSDAGMNDVEQQIIDAEAFLESNFDELNLISQTKEIQYATLRFGVRHYADKFTNDVYLPSSLMKHVGELGLSVELSSYTADRDKE